jgi:NAD-dependent dihydropyrimidine dehydrogenase PreA subunit
MAIEKIDSALCDGCGICVEICCADVIRMNEREWKAVIQYPDDCAVCRMCEIECPQHAIYVSQTLKASPLTLWG